MNSVTEICKGRTSLGKLKDDEEQSYRSSYKISILTIEQKSLSQRLQFKDLSKPETEIRPRNKSTLSWSPGHKGIDASGSGGAGQSSLLIGNLKL